MTTQFQSVDSLDDTPNHDRLLDSLLYREEVEEYDPDEESDEWDSLSNEDDGGDY